MLSSPALLLIPRGQSQAWRGRPGLRGSLVLSFQLPVKRKPLYKRNLVGGAEKPVLGSCPQGEDSLVEGGDLQQIQVQGWALKLDHLGSSPGAL